MHLVVNGQIQLGYWRIDNLDERLEGMDFLGSPFAMVRSRADAELICTYVNTFLSQEDVRAEEVIRKWQGRIRN